MTEVDFLLAVARELYAQRNGGGTGIRPPMTPDALAETRMVSDVVRRHLWMLEPKCNITRLRTKPRAVK